jgi:hypothetical protein
MSEKVYVRKVETWTVSAASEPIEVNVEALRNCVPPYEGDSDEELAKYLYDIVYMNYDFYENETNKEVYGEEAVYELCMEEVYDMEEFFDSRNKGEESFIQIGTPNPEWTKQGGFQPTATGKYENNY